VYTFRNHCTRLRNSKYVWITYLCKCSYMCIFK